jgi:tol-pal system protein YbgF
MTEQPPGQLQQSAAGTAPTAMSADPALPPTREEKDAYRMAFNLLKEGRYDRSIRAFSSFLDGYPTSTYADNAQYWLGEANYVSRKYSAAVKEFGKVVSNFPDSTKAPDAMLKLGFTHYELKQWDKAREMLSAVIQKHPKSSAAKLAETRLKRMQSEGH